MKRFMAFALLLGLILFNAGSPAHAEEMTTLTFQIDSDMSLDGFEAVAALAEQKLGIHIEYELRVGGTEGDNIVKTRLASGDMADICGYNPGALLNALHPEEYFADLSAYEWMDRLTDEYRACVTSGSHLFGIPMTTMQAGGVIYSRPLYEQYDLEIPKTWDEFIENCNILKQAGKVPVIGAFGDTWTSQVLFLGDYFNLLSGAPDFTRQFEAGTAKYADTPSALRSFGKYADLIGLYNEDYLATTYDDAIDMLAEGQCGHWFMLTQCLSNVYALYGQEAVDNLGLFGVPADQGETGLVFWMPISMYANVNSEKLDDVLRFFEFYLSDEALDAFVSAQLPDGPFCVKDYPLPDKAYRAVAEDMQAYFDAGLTHAAMEFETAVKGANCMGICVEAASGQINAEEAARMYDEDCLKQAIQLGLDWR